MGLAVAVASGFVIAPFAVLLGRGWGGRAGWVVALLPAFLTLFFALLVAEAGVAPASFALPWIPSLGLTVTFRADGLGLLFALLISGIGALVMVYAGGYFGHDRRVGRLLGLLLSFMAAMLGLVLSDNVLALFVFWELTSVTSFLLVGFDHEREDARAAALQAFLVTGAGGLALLAGLILLATTGGSFTISELTAAGDAIRAHPLYLPALVLVLLGAFTKSAQMPFHIWLPGAMAAPTPVSAYLHSATMVKAGVYLLLRLSPALGGTPAWTVALGVTALLGAWIALGQTDLKRLLAYSTVAALGTIVLLTGIGTAAALQAAVLYLLAHAIYKGALFLIAGALDHETGSRDVTVLGGLRRAMPVTAAAGMVAALSMAGVPPLLGFVGKEAAYAAALGGVLPAVTAAVAVTSSVFLVVVAGITGAGPFLGMARPTPKPAHEAPPALLLGPLLLAGLGVALAPAAALLEPALLGPAVAAVTGGAEVPYISLWHGLNTALILSTVTLALGVVGYARRGDVRRLSAAGAPLYRWGPLRWYDGALALLPRVAAAQTRVIQSGSLRRYLLVTVGTAGGLAGYALITGDALLPPRGWTDLRVHEAALAALAVAGALAAARSSSRLGSVACLGVSGYSIALIYLLYGAPDLAITQFLVETLIVVVFVLVFHHLPRFASLSRTSSRVRDAAVAVTFGALMTAFVWSALATHAPSRVSPSFAAESYPTAQGRNIVNVILVDFRALDTLGEITVLAVAAAGIVALVRLRAPGGRR
jgi:multicomponent Na+:H+ antiporter subunit A